MLWNFPAIMNTIAQSAAFSNALEVNEIPYSGLEPGVQRIKTSSCWLRVACIPVGSATIVNCYERS